MKCTPVSATVYSFLKGQSTFDLEIWQIFLWVQISYLTSYSISWLTTSSSFILQQIQKSKCQDRLQYFANCMNQNFIHNKTQLPYQMLKVRYVIITWNNQLILNLMKLKCLKIVGMGHHCKETVRLHVATYSGWLTIGQWNIWV